MPNRWALATSQAKAALAASLLIDLAGQVRRVSLDGGYSFHPHRRVRLDLSVDLSYRALAGANAGFSETIAKGGGASRLAFSLYLETIVDLGLLSPAANGAVALRLGYGGLWYAYDGASLAVGEDYSEMLDIRVTLGVHITEAVSLEAFYSQRKDSDVGGLPGFTFFRGFFGYFGATARWQINDTFGLVYHFEGGSAVSNELALELNF